MSAENLQYQDFWYIKLNPDSKLPAEKWGGYGNDPTEAHESDDPDINLYSHEDVLESDHEAWGVAGIRGAGRSLLIYDLDIYKADDFDPDEIKIDGTESVPVVKSPSGGLHVYTAVYEERADGSESDFSVSDKLPFDIDIRGSFVKAHVVAPNAIPGVGGDYEVTNDVKLMTHSDVRDSVDVLKFAENDEPIISYDVSSGVGDFDFERAGEPPEDMPACYHAGLQLRNANPDDHPNTFKVNTLTAMCGIAAGYDLETMIGHFCDDFPPGENADRSETRRHLEYLFEKFERGDMLPPSVSTLREWAIFGDDETCNCSIEYHGGASGARSPAFDVIAEAKAATDMNDTQAEADGGEVEVASDGQPGDFGLPSEPTLQERVHDVLRAYDGSDDMTQKTVVHRVAQVIVDEESFVYPPENARQWRSVLYRYDADEGIYRPDGKRYAEELCERLLGDFLNNTQASELVGKIKRMSGVRKERLEVEPYRLVVGNGILDLRTGDLEAYHPDDYHRTKIHVDYHPDAECPRIDEFFHEIVENKDVRTLYQLAAHGLYREYAAEKAAMLVGGGQNGKSVFLDLLEHLLGGDNVTHRSLQELSHDDFAAAELHGKLANFHPDMSGESIKDLGMFKKLTGRDTMLANVKYEQPIKFENYASLIFAANTMPAMDEDTHALWRRWIYINFPFKFDDSDPDAKDETPKRVLMRELTAEDELEGLLARCVEEITEWWDGRDWFTNTMGADAVRKKMKRAGEPVFAFATTCLEADEDGAILKDEVRECYRRYARVEDLPTESDNVFGEKILNIQDLPVESGQKRYNGNTRTVYKGVAWSSRGEQLMDDDVDETDGYAQQADLSSPTDDGGPRGRAETVLDAMRALGGDTEPVPKAMIMGRATVDMDLDQFDGAWNNLKDQGAIFPPADADDGEWMIK